MKFLGAHAQESLQYQSTTPLFRIRSSSIFRFLVVVFALWLCNSFSFGQECPLSGWRRWSSTASKSSKQAAKTSKLSQQLTFLKIPLNAPVTNDIAGALANDSRFSKCNLDPNPRCAWTADPWPFKGISLDSSSGTIVGTPEEVVEAQVDVVATDNQTGDSYEARLSIEVVPTTLAVTTTALPHHPAGEAIEEFLRAEGGGTPIWKPLVKDPNLPDGVTLNANGKLSGVPRAPGTYNFKVTVEGSPTVTKKLHLKIGGTAPQDPSPPQQPSQVPTGLTVTTPSLPQFLVNNPIHEFLQAGGGKGPYLWTRLGPPNLPNGLTLGADGLLSGTPTAPAEVDFDATVTDLSMVQQAPPRDLQLVITPAPDCGNDKYTKDAPNDYFNGWVPLSRHRDTDPNGHNTPFPSTSNKKQWPTENDVQCLYNAPGLVSTLGRVQYIYGFDGGANTLAADLVSVQMPAPVGVQVSFGSSVTGGGTGKPASTSNSGQTQPNVSAALQSVEAGGNFYVRALYPIALYSKPHLIMSLYAAPKMGFSFNGFASQATLSQGTEQYFSFPLEASGQYIGIGNVGGLYVDYRGGLESVPGSFARNAGLSQHNFLLHQFAFGFDFGGFRIGAQRFIGPSAAFNAGGTSASSFNKWHLVIQMSPKGGG